MERVLAGTASLKFSAGLRRWLVLGCLCLGVARAEVLVSYDFRGQDGVQAVTEPAQVASHLEASAIGRGAGYVTGTRVGMTQDTMAFVPKAESMPSLFLQPYTLGEAIEHGAYFEITLKPEEGYVLSVQSIALGTRRASRRSGPNHFEVRSSLDGFSRSLTQAIPTAGLGGSESTDLKVDFGRTLQNLHTAVTLRFYGFGRAAPTEQPGIWAISNPVGGVAVIEGRLTRKAP